MLVVKSSKSKRKSNTNNRPAEFKIAPTELKKFAVAFALMSYYSYSDVNFSLTDIKTSIPIFKEAMPVIEQMKLPMQAWNAVINNIMDNGEVDDADDDLENFNRALQTVQKELAKDSNQSPMLLDIINWSRLSSMGSDSAFRNLDAKIGLLKNTILMNLLSKQQMVNSQSDLLPKFKAVVKKLGGKGIMLDLDKRKDYQGTPKYAEYLQLRRDLSVQAKSFIRSWVRTNGDKHGLADFEALIKALKDGGFEYHTLPVGFKGKVNDQGQIFTSTGKALNGTPGGGTAKMNPAYKAEEDNAYVFTSIIPGAKTHSRYYTMDYRNKANKSKFVKTEALGDKIPAMRKKWRAILKAGSDENDTDFLATMVLEIIYQTQARVGSTSNKSEVNGKYQTTYGLTTIECRHIRKTNKGLNIIYKGKKAGKQIHKLESAKHPAIKKIVKYILEWKDERDGDEPVFQTARGGPLRASVVNEMLRRCGAPQGVTVHKLRTLKGTAMFADIAAKHPFNKPAKATEVTAWIKSKALAIGKQLGHMSNGKYTATTSIQNYVEPSLMLGLYKAAHAVPPKAMLKLVGVNTDNLEGYEG